MSEASSRGMSVEDPPTPRTFLLDTNVLLFDPTSIDGFGRHDVVIPITVIEEVDRFKKDLNETGRNARAVSRRLDELRASGSLARGVPHRGGGELRVALLDEAVDLPLGFGAASNDNLILATVLQVARGGRGVTLITRDTNMRIKADALGIAAEDYLRGHVDVDESYTGVGALVLPQKQIAELVQKGGMVFTPDEAAAAGIYPNQFLVITAEGGAPTSTTVRYDERHMRLRSVSRSHDGIWGVSPRNREQGFALDLLLDDSVSIVTLDGMAGTGKTLLAIAAGLKLVADERRFRRLVVSRPIFPLGRDVGFLPGDLKEKLNPWMQPIFDNLDLLVGGGADTGYTKGGPVAPRTPGYQPLIDQGFIEIEALTYIRGRSLPKQFLIVDEAQNLTPHEVKTVITRAGEGTKVVLTGDPNQIDNPYVDAASNGLTTVVERFKGSAIAGHVTLRKGERSALAELAAKVL